MSHKQDQFNLFEAYQQINETSKSYTAEQLAKKFDDDVLSQYQYDKGKDSFNCAWATMTFCDWCEKKINLPCKAIYFAWSIKQKENGYAHIAPIYNNNIIDITFGQFDKNLKTKITPVSNWESTYKKYGYDKSNIHIQKGKEIGPIHIDTFKNIEKWAAALDMDLTIYPPKKTLKSNEQ